MSTIHSQSWLECKNPLIIASSGGGGHIVAAESLIQQIEEKNSVLLPELNFKPHKSKNYSFSDFLNYVCQIFHKPRIHHLIAKFIPLQLPTSKQLQAEINHLIHKNEDQPKKYIDFMLDIQPNGYAFTGLFNHLQKTGHPYSLNLVTQQQYWIDKIYKKKIIQQFEQILSQALAQKKPFDSLIITQPIGLSAICRAISKYNLKRLELSKQYQITAPELHIHLFVTDIPYTTAKHYLIPLKELDFLEKQHLIIHVLDVGPHYHILEKKHATQVFRYSPQYFPIIRRPFKQENHDSLNMNIPVLRISDCIIPVSNQEKIASMMLSSSQGDLTLDYLNQLLKLNFQHIVVIGPIPKKLMRKIQALQKKHKQSNIYLPGFVQAQDLSHILKVSQFIILKGGGLSLMEIAAMSLSKKTLIFVHQNQSLELETFKAQGLSWEQGNTEWFIQYNQEHHQPSIVGQPESLTQYLTNPQSLLKRS